MMVAVTSEPVDLIFAAVMFVLICAVCWLVRPSFGARHDAWREAVLTVRAREAGARRRARRRKRWARFHVGS